MPCGLIKPSRGVRQGDPLWPYIFIICFELLNMSLLSATNQPKCGIGIKISPRVQTIPCLTFTDDCLIFSKANYSTCCKLKAVLDDFCDTYRQMINFHKSSLTFSRNATQSQKHLASGLLNITWSDSLGRYLGCPAFQGRPQASVFQDLVARTMSKLEG